MHLVFGKMKKREKTSEKRGKKVEQKVAYANIHQNANTKKGKR